MKMLTCWVFAVTVGPVHADGVPAFPGAEGYGASATGGRGGRVIAVTNLHDSGPGSLQAACDAEGPKIVVFKVAGTIDGDIRIGDRRVKRTHFGAEKGPTWRWFDHAG